MLSYLQYGISQAKITSRGGGDEELPGLIGDDSDDEEVDRKTHSFTCIGFPMMMQQAGFEAVSTSSDSRKKTCIKFIEAKHHVYASGSTPWSDLSISSKAHLVKSLNGSFSKDYNSWRRTIASATMMLLQSRRNDEKDPVLAYFPTWASTRRCLPTGGLQACWWGCVNRPRQPPPRTRFPYHREYNIYGAGVWDVTTIEVDCRRSHLERIADNGLSESLFLFKVTPQHYSVFRSQVGSSSGRSGGRTSSTSSNPKKERK